MGTLIRKTSLLRTVPTACGQAADKLTPFATFTSRPELGVARTNATFVTPDARSGPTSSRCQISSRSRPATCVAGPASRVALEPFGRTAKRNCHFTDEQSSINPAGGARRDRTDDLLLAKQALSQLSYSPAVRYPSKGGKWWAWEDLNFRPHAYQARALTN